MSRKRMNLEEARKKNKLKRFAKEHPSKADKEQFDELLNAMEKTEKPKSSKASGKT